MAFDLVIWKWAANAEEVDPAEVDEALAEDDPHPAVTRFDIGSFESAIRAKFGDVNEDPDGPFLYEVCDFTEVPANWVCISVNWSQVSTVCPIIAEIARSQGLAVYDPQGSKTL
jgi:hypothetical protein